MEIFPYFQLCAFIRTCIFIIYNILKEMYASLRIKENYD